MNERRLTIQAIGLALLLVGAGAAIGIAAERTWLAQAAVPPETKATEPRRFGPPGDGFQKRILEKFQRRLDLTAEQSVKVEAILDGVHKRATALHSEVKPQMRAMIEDSDEQIRAVLTEAQRVEYEKLVVERNERFRRFGHGRHKRGHGHP